MKKLTVLFAILMAASVMFAQKTTWVNQSGFNNTANVLQSACTSQDATSIYAVQSGTWNTLNSSQTGPYNYVELYQSGSNNDAFMEQYTCNIDFPGPGVYYNDADVYQSGNSNSAALTQEEDDDDGWDYSTNTANAVQSGAYNSYLLSQGTQPWKPLNNSYLKQSGFDNDAGIIQHGYKNYSEALQNGNWNTASLDQQDAAMVTPSIWSKSYSWQLGENNLLDVYQHGNAGLQYANSLQNGSSNITNVAQSSWGVQEVISDQKGNSDIINVSQSN